MSSAKKEKETRQVGVCSTASLSLQLELVLYRYIMTLFDSQNVQITKRIIFRSLTCATKTSPCLRFASSLHVEFSEQKKGGEMKSGNLSPCSATIYDKSFVHMEIRTRWVREIALCYARSKVAPRVT